MTDNFSIYLERITQDIIDAIPDATLKAAVHVHQVAVSRTPVETSNLRNESAVVNVIDGRGAAVYYPGPYARYQEFGVSHTGKELRHVEGQSFYLVTSILGEAEAALEIMTTEFRKALH